MWRIDPSVKIATAGTEVSFDSRTKSGLEFSRLTCGVSVHWRDAPGSVNRNAFPHAFGTSVMAAPVAFSRSRKTLRNRCSRWDSGSS